MKNTFVIVNYNDYETTIKLLDNITNYNLIDEIVIVDNKSNDDSLINFKKINNPKLKIIESDKNGGYSYALNIGCKYIVEKYKESNIFISNSDIVIKKEEDLKILVNQLDEKNVVVAPVINTHGNKSYGWKIPTIWQEILFNLPIIQNKIQNKLNYKEGITKKISVVDTVSGCFFLINSNHLKQINYFDDNVFLYYEENILGIKTKKMKKNIVLVKKVEVLHNHSITINKNVKKINKIKIQKKSQYYFEKKYNKANIAQLQLLKLTSFIAIILLNIKYKIEK